MAGLWQRDNVESKWHQQPAGCSMTRATTWTEDLQRAGLTRNMQTFPGPCSTQVHT
jgi:hypothetical protein